MPAPKGSRNAALGDETYSKLLQVRVPPSKFEQYEKRAKQLDIKLTEHIRRLLDDDLNRRG